MSSAVPPTSVIVPVNNSISIDGSCIPVPGGEPPLFTGPRSLLAPGGPKMMRVSVISDPTEGMHTPIMAAWSTQNCTGSDPAQYVQMSVCSGQPQAGSVSMGCTVDHALQYCEYSDDSCAVLDKCFPAPEFKVGQCLNDPKSGTGISRMYRC